MVQTSTVGQTGAAVQQPATEASNMTSSLTYTSVAETVAISDYKAVTFAGTNPSATSAAAQPNQSASTGVIERDQRGEPTGYTEIRSQADLQAQDDEASSVQSEER